MALTKVQLDLALIAAGNPVVLVMQKNGAHHIHANREDLEKISSYLARKHKLSPVMVVAELVDNEHVTMPGYPRIELHPQVVCA